MRTHISGSAAAVMALGSCCGLAASARAVDSAGVKALFADPPREYSTAPLWVWNDWHTPEQVVESLRDLAGRNVRQVFIHPRPGLITPYLGPEWFQLWEACLEEARRLDMNLWIYDENSYPSGFAGGRVPEAMPESRGLGLVIRETDKAPVADENLVGAYRMTDGGFQDVTADCRAGRALPEGRYVTAVVVQAPVTAWHGGRYYVDLMRPGVTEKFIELTLEPYRQHFGHEFGKRIPGVFQDEAHIRPADAGVPWTPGLPEAFRKRWGYDLLAHLPSLNYPLGDFRRVRHNFLQVCLELFIEHWARPYFQYCSRHNLEFTGHYWEHDWPYCLRVPDNMAMYAWHQRPAIDILLNIWSDGLQAQTGNVRAVRELGSVANQLGLKRTLCEAYGAAGWELRFEDMKRIGDWLYVLGVNTLDEHLSHVSIRGARKHDHPQSFSYHAPWWEAYGVSASYFARLSAAMSQGRQINDVLLIEPTTTVWMYNSDVQAPPDCDQIAQAFEDIVRAWEQAQIEYDIGSEDIIARHGSVSDGAFVVGQRAYRVVVLPPRTENLNTRTVELLERYLAAGGTVLCCGEPPERMDGAVSDRPGALSRADGWRRVTPEQARAELEKRQTAGGFFITRPDGDEGRLFHHRRVIDDGEILLVVNSSIEKPARCTVAARAGGAEEWDLRSGKAAPLPFQRRDGSVSLDLELPPCGSRLLFLSKQPIEPAPPVRETVRALAAIGGMTVERLDPNVLTLDYVDVACQGESRTGLHIIKARDWLFARHGFERNPWDRGVQFHDTHLRRTFAPDSGFEASYRFTIAGEVPRALSAVVERADLFTISCNGAPVALQPGSWWLDRQFGRLDIAAAARTGENVLTLRARPFSVFHEIAEVYILGDFALRPAERGFVIEPARPLEAGDWRPQGMPMYGHRVAYARRFKIDRPAEKYRVVLGRWYGSIAKVSVNGQDAGWISCAPWTCEVGPLVRAGENTVQVVVYGTPRNILGPFHNPSIGLTGPWHFDASPESGPPPGDKYFGIGYGLFEAFELQEITASR